MVTGEAMAMPAEALAEAKAYLRVDGTAEDAGIAGLLSAAAAVCEAFGGAVLIARVFEEVVPGTPAWTRLARTPVREILGVGGVGGVVLPVAGYASDIDANGDGWVRVTGPPGRVRVRYRAGLAESWGGLPAPLRQGVVRLAAHLYVRRGGDGDAAPPAAVTALWRPYRRMRLR